MKNYTKEEVLRFISEALDRAEEPEGKQQVSKEERFWQLMLQTNSIKIDKEKYPNSTFGFVDDKCLWEYDSKNRYLWIDYYRVWSILRTEYQLNDNDIQRLIKTLVEEYFNCKGVTPLCIRHVRRFEVEEHFNCKGVTPVFGFCVHNL